jgi:Ca2+-binding EF-hand superfamily protein
MPAEEYFNSETRNEIRNLFRQLIQNERATECLRVRIARRSNFALKSAFQYCDKNLDNTLTSDDIRSMLADHGFFATERELTSIMRKFDKDMD